MMTLLKYFKKSLSILFSRGKRIEQIKSTSLINLKEDLKIYWENFPIAQLSPGKDYLNP